MKEVYAALAMVTGVLLLIFVCNQFVRYLGRAAAGKMSGALVVKIMAIQIPFLAGLLLPAGFFLGILLAYGRLYVDSEMTVLVACGMSRDRLLKMTQWMGVAVIVVTAFLNFYVSPALLTYQNKMMLQAQSNALVQAILPGRFQAVNSGNVVYYIEKISRKRGNVRNIFVAQREKKGDGEVWNVMAADRGYEYVDPKTNDHFVVAKDGHRYFGKPGEKQFKMIDFGEYGVRLPSRLAGEDIIYEALPTTKLWNLYAEDTEAAAELQWRISLPLSVPLLALLAVPLSKVRPRRGRYAQLLPSILIYSIYGNMLFVAKSWVATGKVPVWIGMWWLHALLLGLALSFYLSAETRRKIGNFFCPWRLA
jgi:lipopolysaccharide export system permease protein